MPGKRDRQQLANMFAKNAAAAAAGGVKRKTHEGGGGVHAHKVQNPEPQTLNSKL